MPEAPNPSVPPPIPPNLKPSQDRQEPITQLLRLIGLAALSFSILAAVCLIYLGVLWINTMVNRAKNMVQEVKAQQAVYELNQKPHREMLAKIEDIKANGRALPACPLIYPLKDEKGKNSPLGASLSLWAMEQATNLPKAVFRLEYESYNFQAFRLFENQESYHQGYQEQLPYLFNVKDFGNGTLIKTRHGYRVKLTMEGTRPVRKYEKTFSKKGLHLISAWMASCVQDWMGFQPNAAQKAFRDTPIFNRDDDLTYNVSVRPLLEWDACSLIMRWEKLESQNPGSTFLFSDELQILDDREGGHHLDLAESMLAKFPDNTPYQDFVITGRYYEKQYEGAQKLLLERLKGDDNNAFLNQWSAYCLEYNGFWDEAIHLLKNWAEKYPENSQAWIALAQNCRSWAGGEEWQHSKHPSTVKLFNERIAEGVGYAKRASQVGPKNEKAWAQLVAYGKDAALDPATMEGYFQKAIALNPNDYQVYADYLEFIKSRSNGDEKPVFAFAHKYGERFPALITDPCTDDFMVEGDTSTPEGQKKRLDAMRTKIADSPHWREFKTSIEAYLKRSPADLGEWKCYLDWADLRGDVEPVYRLAKTLSNKNPQLRALYPTVLLLYREEGLRNCATDSEKSVFLGNLGMVRQMGEAYRQLARLDPGNFHVLNQLAAYQVNNQMYAEARNTFRKIGKHWAFEVWSREEFDKAKARASK